MGLCLWYLAELWYGIVLWYLGELWYGIDLLVCGRPLVWDCRHGFEGQKVQNRRLSLDVPYGISELTTVQTVLTKFLLPSAVRPPIAQTICSNRRNDIIESERLSGKKGEWRCWRNRHYGAWYKCVRFIRAKENKTNKRQAFDYLNCFFRQLTIEL